jgi:ribosomal protein L29
MKYKEINRLSKEEREEKLKELRFELIKKNVTANKASKIKAKEIKKSIARILTANNTINKIEKK